MNLKYFKCHFTNAIGAMWFPRICISPRSSLTESVSHGMHLMKRGRRAGLLLPQLAEGAGGGEEVEGEGEE